MDLIEEMYDEKGNLLLSQPYPFKRLFAVGQEQVINSVSLKVISCSLAGNKVTTVVRVLG